MNNAVAVIAVSERGTMYDPARSSTWRSWSPVRRPPTSSTSPRRCAHNIQAVAKAKGGDIEDVTVVILDRPRHDEMVREIREAGARIKFIATATWPARSWPCATAPVSTCCSASAARRGASSRPARSKCLGGTIQSRLWPRNDEERATALEQGHDLDRVLYATTWSAATTSSSWPPA
jgi:fructose-1,6-bisphosphatase II